jgi:hypothetical protein
MARRKNVKRIDPRYFLNETVNRNDDGSRLEEGFVDMVGSLANRAGLFGKESKHAEWWARVAKPILKQEMGDDYDHSLAHDIRQQWKAAGSELDAETVAQTIKDAVEFSKLASDLDLLDYRSLENVRNSYTLDSLRKLAGGRAKRKDDERMKRRDRAMSSRDFGPGETMATHRYDIMVNRDRAARKGWDREKALDNGLSVDGNFGREWDGKAPDPDDLEAARKKARESTRGVGR